jgi:hypothetical protein
MQKRKPKLEEQGEERNDILPHHRALLLSKNDIFGLI